MAIPLNYQSGALTGPELAMVLLFLGIFVAIILDNTRKGDD